MLNTLFYGLSVTHSVPLSQYYSQLLIFNINAAFSGDAIKKRRMLGFKMSMVEATQNILLALQVAKKPAHPLRHV